MAVMWAYFKVMKPWRELRLCLQNLNLQEGRKIMEKRFEKVSAKFRKELEKDIKMTIINYMRQKLMLYQIVNIILNILKMKILKMVHIQHTILFR